MNCDADFKNMTEYRNKSNKGMMYAGKYIR